MFSRIRSLLMTIHRNYILCTRRYQKSNFRLFHYLYELFHPWITRHSRDVCKIKRTLNINAFISGASGVRELVFPFGRRAKTDEAREINQRPNNNRNRAEKRGNAGVWWWYAGRAWNWKRGAIKTALMTGSRILRFIRVLSGPTGFWERAPARSRLLAINPRPV